MTNKPSTNIVAGIAAMVGFFWLSMKFRDNLTIAIPLYICTMAGGLLIARGLHLAEHAARGKDCFDAFMAKQEQQHQENQRLLDEIKGGK